ncbi:MAG: hypothetical protein FalmKO_38740 [Falsiruegeria mediterranea]
MSEKKKMLDPEGVKATVIDSYKPEGALFGFLKELSLYSIVAPISLVLIVIFFVTSSDSGSLVIDTITAGGKMDAPVVQRVFWCTLEGLVAIALLLGGGLSALKGAAVSTGIPFTFVVLIMCYCLWLALKAEHKKLLPTLVCAGLRAARTISLRASNLHDLEASGPTGSKVARWNRRGAGANRWGHKTSRIPRNDEHRHRP